MIAVFGSILKFLLEQLFKAAIGFAILIAAITTMVMCNA